MSTRMQTLCPVCRSTSDAVDQIPKSRVLSSLSRLFGQAAPASICAEDYEIYRCRKCELEFANPLTSGSHEFYDWVTAQAGYYTATRWEYGEVISKIASSGKTAPRILDVGCGSGEFLAQLCSAVNAQAVGLDMTATSVANCRARGLTAHCATLDSFLSAPNYDGTGFDFVVSFHCLEHVNNPLGFAREMVNAAKPGGRIFVSTPLSPMSFESRWFDPLNHPPHHITRWGIKAFRQLAEELKTEVLFHLPAPPSALRRSVRSAAIASVGPKYSKSQAVRAILAAPFAFLSDLRRQAARKLDNVGPLPDVVLAEFIRPATSTSSPNA